MLSARYTYFSGVLLLLFYNGLSQNHSIDVQHYRFNLTLNDTTDQIDGRADISFIPLENASQVFFDLIDRDKDKGMQVAKVESYHKKLIFTQKKDRIYIHFDESITKGEQQEISVYYRGIPADGLIIDTNKFGQRTFFTDNWPERARNWLPVNDHPSDKATVEFIVTAPDHYQVVGNGMRVEETSLPNGNRLTHWKMDMEIPTKVMAIGVADFAVQYDTLVNRIPVENWVFTKNREQGFRQYRYTSSMLPFFEDYIAPFPYKKLANVQSKTIFGGMENASNIFYYENSVKQDTPVSSAERLKQEALMAHETAHQWFGDSVSETDWEHLWLSEGFSTYLADLYMGYQHGEERFKERLKKERHEVVDFYKKIQRPVIDTIGKKNPMEMLNPNSYQKGAWVLHMLRQELGDSVFQKSIQKFYQTYQGKNASTEDFRTTVEEVSGQNLQSFFKQWLYRPGFPVLEVHWNYDEPRQAVRISIEQKQEVPFEFPLEIQFSNTHTAETHSVQVTDSSETFYVPLKFNPKETLLDPEVKLLYKADEVKRL